MADVVPQEQRWAAHLKDLGCQLKTSVDASARERIRGEVWPILRVAIFRYLQCQAGRFGDFAPEDLEDLASQKSLDLVRRLDSGRWDPSALEVEEIPRILATVARNGLVDRLRLSGRAGRAVEFDEEYMSVGAGSVPTAEGVASPDREVETKEFVQALLCCVEALEARSRLIWFFRVFYEMPSKEIAAHPEIRLNRGHVDVLLQRARIAIRDCMKRCGFEPTDMPPGAFAGLWSAFRLKTAESIKVPQ